MFRDARTFEKKNAGAVIKADICVVGAGIAGISFTLPFLKSADTSVVIIESGGLNFCEEVQSLSDATVKGHPYYNLRECRIRMFGGSSIAWGGILAPLDAADFLERSWVPESGWPIAREDLEPYYKSALALCRATPGEDPIDSDEARSGFPSGVCVPEIYFTAPARFGKMFRKQFDESKNVVVYLWSNGVKLHFDENRACVRYLSVKSVFGEVEYSVTANHFVLAGGGIENPRLLLASQALTGSIFYNRRDLLGRYFHDHLRVFDKFLLPGTQIKKLENVIKGSIGNLEFSRLGVSANVRRKERLLNYVANLRFGYVGDNSEQFFALRRIVMASGVGYRHAPYFPDMEGGRNKIRIKDIKSVLRRPILSAMSGIGAALNPRVLRRSIEIASNLEQSNQSSNRVVLAAEKDRFGVPKAELRWTIDSEMEHTYRRGLDLVIATLERYAPDLRKHPIKNSEPWPGAVVGNWHHMGTTRMSSNPSRGVVNSDCKVHGIENLYLAGSSVFPTGGAASPTLTIIALALRLSDRLKKRIKAERVRTEPLSAPDRAVAWPSERLG